MKLRLRGDVTLDLELSDRAQIPQVAELLWVDGQWYRVAEMQRGFVTVDGAVTGWDIAARVAKTNVAQDMLGTDVPEQLPLPKGEA